MNHIFIRIFHDNFPLASAAGRFYIGCIRHFKECTDSESMIKHIVKFFSLEEVSKTILLLPHGSFLLLFLVSKLHSTVGRIYVGLYTGIAGLENIDKPSISQWTVWLL